MARVPSILLLGLVYVTYVLLGGVIFWKLEGDLGQMDVKQLLLKKQMLLSNYTCLDQEGLEALIQVRHRKTTFSFMSFLTFSPKSDGPLRKCTHIH